MKSLVRLRLLSAWFVLGTWVPAHLSAATNDLAVQIRTAADGVPLRSWLEYTVTVNNAGPDTAANVTLTNTPPVGTALVSARVSQGTCSTAANQVVCELGALPAYRTASLWLQLQPATTGILTNSTTVTSDGMDPISTNNWAAAAILVSTNEFYPISPMDITRYDHTDLLLPDGRVLICGGAKTMTLYDPTTLAFSRISGLTNINYGPGPSVMLTNGTVLMVSAHGTFKAEVFNPATGQLRFTPDLDFYQNSPTATLLADGRVLVVGGDFSEVRSDLYDPVADTWTVRGSLVSARISHTATLLPSGKVLIAGGFGTSSILQTAELFDPATGTFAATGSMNQPRYSHTATLLPTGKVLIIGGDNTSSPGMEVAELYDPATGSFTPTGSLNRMRSRHTATLLPNNTVLVAGGTGPSSASGYLASAEIYDIATGRFSLTVDLNLARQSLSAVLLTNGAVLLTGGANSTFLPVPAMAFAELYDYGGLYHAPSITVSDVAVLEGNSVTNSLVFNFCLSSTSSLPVTVAYATTSGTARSGYDPSGFGYDYYDVSGTLTFPAGVTNQSVAVPIRSDTIYEPDESLMLNLSFPTYGLIAGHSAGGTILNDDPLPAVSINAVTNSLSEGDSGLSYAQFVVSLSSASAVAATVAYSKTDGTATAGSDYLSAAGTLTFAPGETNKTISVGIIGDLTVEPDETFWVALSSSQNATILPGTGMAACTIRNDDGLPDRVHHFDVSAVSSPQFQTVPFAVTITARNMNGDPATSFTGPVLISSYGTNYSATNLDFEQPALSPWIPLNTSDYPGPYELVPYDIAGNGLVSTAFRTITGSGTDGIAQNIWLNGGITYTLRVNFAAAMEGGGGCWAGGGTARLEIDNTNASWTLPDLCTGHSARTSVSVLYRPALSGYHPLRVSFSRVYSMDMAYATYADNIQISCPPISPAVLSNFVNGVWTGSISAPQPGTNIILLADDTQSHKGLGNAFDVQPVADLGLSGTQSYVPSIRTGDLITYNLAVTNRGPSTVTDAVVSCPLPPSLAFLSATNSSGGVTNSAGTLQWALGSLPQNASASTRIVTRAVLPGGFTNLFSVASSVTDLVPANNTLVLTNIIYPPILSIAPGSGIEAPASVTGIVLNVTLSAPSAQTISADYYTVEGSAHAGIDYIPTNGTVSFPPFTTNASIWVFAIDNDLYQPTRTLVVCLTNYLNAVPLYDNAGAQILDDDTPPVVSIADTAVLEGDSGTTNALFQVSLSKHAIADVTVWYSTGSGTATTNDYVSASGQVRFPADTTTNQTISIAVRGNTVNEPDETFSVSLSNPNNANLGKSSATGTILNDDAVPGRLDHFSFNPMLSPQYAGRPFSLSVRAVDYLGTPVSSAGSATLTAQTDQYYTLRLLEDFESGTLGGWTNYGGSLLSATNTTETGALGSHCLKLTGQATTLSPGVSLQHRLITNARPTGISFYARAAQTNAQCNRVMAVGGALYRAMDFYMNRDGRMGLYAGSSSGVVPYESNRWYKIDITLDWTARRTACSVDNALVITNVPFPDDPYSGTDYIAIQNIDAATNWLDQFHVFTLSYSNLLTSPGTLSNFNNGLWTGNITVTPSATNSYLTIADGAEHVGRSTNFDLLPLAPAIVVPAAVTEGSPPVPAQLNIPVPFPQDLVIGLTSSVPSELTVPASVTIPAGQTAAAFNLIVLDDGVVDGSQQVAIWAGATNLVTGSTTIRVDDNETAALSIAFPSFVAENAGIINAARINCSPAPAKPVTVFLASSDTNSLQMPASVVIPAGQSSVIFSATLLDNRMIDGARSVVLSAYVANWPLASHVVTVTDNESTLLRLTGLSAASENFGTISYEARLTGTLTTNLTLSLASSDTNSLTVPPTVLIPAGQTSVVFGVTFIDNTNYDGARQVALSCNAPGFTGANLNIDVRDNEIHHLGFSIIGPRTNSVSFSVTISARDIFDGQVISFDAPVTLTGIGALGGTVIVQPSNIFLYSGSASATITLFTAEPQVTLQAITTNGLSGQSAPFTVVPPTVAILNVAAADLAYSETSGLLYASTTNSGSLTTIDPFSLSVGSPLAIGALSGRLCASDGGQYVFAALNSSNRLCQFNVTSRTITAAWNLNSYYVDDMAPVIGSPAAVAVARYALNASPRYRGVAVYDNGIARTNIENSFLGPTVIEPSGFPGRLYGYDNSSSPAGFYWLKVDASGVAIENTLSFLQGFYLDFVAGSDRIFVTPNHQIFDPERGLPLGYFSGSLVRPDAAAGRYYACQFSSSLSTIGVNDLRTLLPVGSLSIPINTGTGRLIRWGTNGLAFPINSSQVAVVRTSLIASDPPANLRLSLVQPAPVIAGNPLTYTLVVSNQGPNTAQNVVATQTYPNNATFVSASATAGSCSVSSAGLVCSPITLPPQASLRITVQLQTLKPGMVTCLSSATSERTDPDLSDNSQSLQLPVISPPGLDSIVEFSLVTADLAWDPVSTRIYASVPNMDLYLGNRIVSFDPMTLVPDAPIPVGTSPSRLAISDDGQYLYAGINSDNTIQRVPLASRLPDLRFPTGYSYVADMAVVPGRPEVVVATVFSKLAVYDTGVRRSAVVDAFYPYSGFQHYLASSGTETLFFEAGPAVLRQVRVDSAGANLIQEVPSTLIPDSNDQICYDAGLVYSSGGRVIDPQANTVLTNLPYTGLCRPDAAHGRVFYLTTSGSVTTLRVISVSDFTELAAINIPNVSGTASSLLRWGTDGLAFRTSAGQVFVLRTTLADDRNRNGLADTWEVQHFGSLSAVNGGPNDDPDGDGFTNLEEYRAGLNPLHFDPARFVQSRVRSDGVFELTALAPLSNSYALMTSTNLSDWTAIFKFTVTNVPTILTDLASPGYPRRFYRLVPPAVVPGPRLRFTSAPHPGAGPVNLILDGVPGFDYSAECSTNLVDWAAFTSFRSTNPVTLFQDSAGSTTDRKFYRVHVP